MKKLTVVFILGLVLFSLLANGVSATSINDLNNVGGEGQPCMTTPEDENPDNFAKTDDGEGPVTDAGSATEEDTEKLSARQETKALKNKKKALRDTLDKEKEQSSTVFDIKCKSGLAPYYNPGDPARACRCVTEEWLVDNYIKGNVCPQTLPVAEKTRCDDCMTPSSGKKLGVWTAFGCMRYSVQEVITQVIFGIGLSIAGMFALLCVIVSAIRIQVSRGDTEKIGLAKDTLTSCIIGLIFIILSVLIMKVIGVDLLGLPGIS